jgi:hypothetical protein
MHEAPDLWTRAFVAMLGALGAMVPLAFRDGLSRTQAGIMFLSGAAGAYALARPLSLWVDPWAPGSAFDIEPACAYFSGVVVMRVCEEVLRFLERRSQKLLDRTVIK